MPKNFRFLNPWGKAMERNDLRFNDFCSEVVLNRRQKKCSFWLGTLASGTLALGTSASGPSEPGTLGPGTLAPGTDDR